MTNRTSVSVLGSGAWGTALANAVARRGGKVTLWARRRDQTQEMAQTRRNEAYLPGILLEEGVVPTSDLSQAARADVILLVIPTQASRDLARALKGILAPGAILVSCAKGIERETLAFPTEVLADELPMALPAVLSGPSFAADVASGLPTAVTLAAARAEDAKACASALATSSFRIYHTDDVRGVEIGGAAKNVMAIAAGIAAGKGLGASAGAALVARAFAELRRFGAAFGARPETLMGLSGLGDLVLTTGSSQSRNFALGHAIGSGQALPSALAEGAHTAKGLLTLASQRGVDMPIAAAVDAVLSGKASASVAVELLLDRPLKAEN